MNECGEPITKCPICRYDLAGLPKNHTCPECGFEYDESMRIWWIKGPSRRFWIIFTILLPLSVFLVLLVLAGTISLAKKGTFWISANAIGAIVSRTLILALLPILGYLEIRFLFWRWPAFLIVGKNTLQIQYFFWKKKLNWDVIVLAGREVTKLAPEPSLLEVPPPIPIWKRGFIPQFLLDLVNPFQIIERRKNGSNSVFAIPPFVMKASAREELHRAIYEAWSKSRAAARDPIPNARTVSWTWA